MPDLIGAGLSAGSWWTPTLMNVEETSRAVARVVRARRLANVGEGAVPKEQGTTSGHLFRGVQ